METRKRPRSSGATSSAMRRTTSLSELAPPARAARGGSAAAAAPVETAAGAGAGAGLSAAQRRHSLDCFPATETAAFLKACGLCNRRLSPGRDTFIYMGEVAFCSHECRQQQMNIDELKEKCFTSAGGGGSDGSSDPSGNSSTIAAA